MPELPEVEATRLAISEFVGRKIKDVIILEQGGGPRNGLIDEKVVENDMLPSLLLKKVVVSVKRRGKYVLIEISGNGSQNHVLLHLGMTGSVVVKGKSCMTYKSFRVKNETWPPVYTKLEIIFAGGDGRMALCDPRRMSRVKLIVGDPMTLEPLRSLALDPLIDTITIGQFKSLLSKYSAPIKAILLDQNKVVCGVGNYIADEVLYHAGIHPESKASSLPDDRLEILLQKIIDVISTAVDCNSRGEDFPSDWLFHYRWDKRKGKSSTMPNGAAIHFETVGGRTSAVVMSVQKKFTAASSASINDKKSGVVKIASSPSSRRNIRSDKKSDNVVVVGRKRKAAL